jgi:hypothetical protein
MTMGDETPIARRNFLKQAGVAASGAMLTSSSRAQGSAPTGDQQPSLVNPEKPMPENVTADQIRELLKLEPNATCVRPTRVRSRSRPADCLHRSRRDGLSAPRSISW